MDKVKFAVIGCGHIGKRHVAVIQAEPHAELVAVCDTVAEKMHQLNLPEGCSTYNNYKELLKNEQIDVVSICSPHGLHKEMSLEASLNKINSLVEKPMALSARDCREMIEGAEKEGVKVFVVKQNRFNVPIALTKKALDENKLGKVYMVQCNIFWNRHKEYYTNSLWRGSKDLEGGALYTQVSHFIDLLIWCFGDIQDARTFTDTLHHEIEIEDAGVSILRFKSGILGTLNWTTDVYNINYEGSISIFGENGTIKIGGKYLNQIDFWDVLSYPLPEDVNFDDKPNDYGAYKGTSSNHDKVIHGVAGKLLNERHHVVEGDEGIKSIEAIEMLYEKSVKK